MDVNQKDFVNSIFIIVVLMFVSTIGYFVFFKRPEPLAQQPSPISSSNVRTSVTAHPDSQLNLHTVFALNNKEIGTKIYYSDTLGVGFTYLPALLGATFAVTERENEIYVYDTKEKPEQGQSIEVFTKNPNLTFQEAIANKFLADYNPKDCFVKVTETNEQELSNYISAVISFPPNADPNGPWWKNSNKCPQNYSETNGKQYFLMNKAVPGKFLFVRIGQYSITLDGTSGVTGSGFNWSHSIKILK